jgi:hypothetical protein
MYAIKAPPLVVTLPRMTRTGMRQSCPQLPDGGDCGSPRSTFTVPFETQDYVGRQYGDARIDGYLTEPRRACPAIESCS